VPALAARRADVRKAKTPTPKVAAFVDTETELLRTVYKEIVVRFKPGISERKRAGLLRKHGFRVVRTNPFVPDQVVIEDPNGKRQGVDLVNVANAIRENDEEVRFATPNFVSQYRREAQLSIPSVQWHLRNTGALAGQKSGEDVRAREAWKRTRGRAGIVIAVLDDGVDIDHPALKGRIWRSPKGHREYGRDFTLKNDQADHYNPRPKIFQPPFDNFDLNDIHGTACSGVAVANDSRCRGIAPRCKLLAVKVFQANLMAEDERVADAIRYAGTVASVISLSWTASRSADVQAALEDIGRNRGGRGVVVLAATGNFSKPVEWPASDPSVIGVGASTDKGELADYSNTGDEVSIVAPSGGGVAEIFTTDVSAAGRGFNLGDAAKGGADGMYTNDFSGTSSATPLAAGVAALVLSVNSSLSRTEVQGILETTADKIGPKSSYNAKGRSKKFGFGRVNAGAAVTAA
jgi:subtilisin family serine protease